MTSQPRPSPEGVDPNALDIPEVFGDPPEGRPRSERFKALDRARPMPGRARLHRRTIDPSQPPVKGIPRLTKEGLLSGTDIYRVDPRGIRYPSPYTDRKVFLTTNDIAQEMQIAPEQAWRWARRWFGALPVGRQGGREIGYRIPLEYRYVARAWVQCMDPNIREKIRWGLVNQLRDYIIVCGDLISTHYTSAEVTERLAALSGATTLSKFMTTIVHVGPIRPEDVELCR